MTIETTTAPRDRGSLILGSILSVPLFFAIYLAVSIVTYMVYTFLQGTSDGVPRIVELSAAVISSIVAVVAGGWVCDKAFKSWSGWPSFILLSLFLLVAVATTAFGYVEDGLWQGILGIIQIGAAVVAAWFILVKRETFT